MKNDKKIKVHFLGAAGTVTGSKYLVDIGEYKIMIDCGLFQGLKELRLKNWEFPPFKPSEIDIVLFTHGHLDHTGYLPRLVKLGFKGAVRGTKPTLEIAGIILTDSGKIQEYEADKANKEGYSKHQPAEALYDLKDALKAKELFEDLPEGEWVELFQDIRVRFQYNGHIIGATFIELDVNGKILVFSGDIGRKEDLLMSAPKNPVLADALFIESTYGDRKHSTENLEEKLKTIINATVEKGGTLIIPSFAVERTQSLMYVLWQLRAKRLIPNIPMIMDSPMGANVLEVFKNNTSWHKLTIDECTKMCEAFTVIQEYKETWEVIDDSKPKIILAGSGMVTGGRVLTYLRFYIGRPETTVLLAGFQAEGTRGRKLLEGAEEVKIYGKQYPVKARIENLEVLSSHADQDDLIDWMGAIKKAPSNIFIVHGELAAAEAFQLKIKETYGWASQIPELYSIYEI